MDELQLVVISNAHTSALNPSSSCFPHTSWLTVCKRKEKKFSYSAGDGWMRHLQCALCVQYISLTFSLPPPRVCPLNPRAKHTPLYSSCWLPRKSVTGTPVPCHHLAPQRGVVAICMSAWCLHVCPWVGCQAPSISVELIGMAAVLADTNLMCQVGGITRAAITSADKQVTPRRSKCCCSKSVDSINDTEGTEGFMQGLCTEVTAVWQTTRMSGGGHKFSGEWREEFRSEAKVAQYHCE